ncbi:TetR/AcrR family transcriptional regulator [Actinoplanes sichuanensis]|uniref:TetR/AcrR family transcriptional regulator n=1 Tax=Actinoplanes sichuanensis TaxID=512349 RepID=A0ABW4AUW0_9ACTN|nr:helix-turn-helix domain-containing protein [Actinoplanes sichuanensis]BEL05206.1 TetR/AcrR family transcriptional regulator [Actinoplanes sichuanensis]
MTGLRERKKQATREALQAAALRLALEHGPDNVRVEDIAGAAGVSPRTYNNYFSSQKQAIVSAIAADRADRLAAAVISRPAETRLSDAVIDAVAASYVDPGDRPAGAMLMIASSPALRSCYADTATMMEGPLAGAVLARHPGADPLAARVLAAAVAAAARIALHQWLQATTTPTSIPGFVVVAGSLPDLVRAALTPLAPALDAIAPPPDPSDAALP